MPEMQSSPGELLPTADAGLVGAPQTDIVAVRLVVHLRSLVEQLFQDSEDRDDVYWTGITLDRLRSMLDLVWLSLAFDAHLDANQIIRNERVAAQALQLLQVIMPRVQQNKWTESERATLLTAIAPLCIDVPRTTGSYEMLVSAGPFSGIRHSMLPDDNSERRSLLRPVLYLRPVLSAVNSENTMESPLLKQIWETPGVLDTFSDQAALFWQILKLDSAATHQTADDADFGPIRVTASTQMTGRATLDAGTSLATSTCLSVALRALLTPSYFKEADRKPVRMRSLVKQLLEDTGVRFILVGEHLLEALQSGYLSLSSNELEGIVDKIGTELLPSYEYSRTEDLQLFVVKFLQATASQWGREEAMEMPYVDKARRLSAWFAGQLLVDNSLSWKVRNACIDLLDHFITSRRVDPLLFGHDTELSACKDGVPVSPDVILIGMLDDADYRVRVKLAPVLGRLCSYIHRVGRQSFSIWTKIAEGAKFDYQGSHLESNITTLLTYSNIMVASDFFRSNAYHPVIVLAALDASASLSMYVKAALTATANRLGLQDTATLYTFLAPFTLAEHLYNSQEGLLIPDPSVFGFPNKQALYSARFEETAPMILAGPRPNFFQELCAYAGTNPETALVKVFPTYIAYKLTAGEPGSGDYKLAEQDIAFKAVQVAAENGLQAPEMLRNMRDLVVWRLFSFVWEAEYSFESLQATISKCWPATPSLQTFLRDVLGGADPPFRPNVLSPPDVRLEAILYSIKRSHPAVAGALDDIAILNSVLHRLLSAVAEPPFTSQQLRLLHNAALCMACSANTLSKSTHLLTMLMHRLATLAQQDDLLPLSSKLFMWVLGQLGALRHAQKSGLQDETHSILLAADAALIYSQREDDVSGRADNVAKRPALEFLRNLEGWIKSLRRYDDPRMNESLNRLSVLWPRPLPPSCNQTLNLEQVQDIVDFAGNTPSVYNALGIFRRSLLQQDSSKDACRISNILWRIFASTNSKLARGSLRPETVRAFADLVFASGGQVCPPGLNGSIQTKRRTVIGDTDARTVMLSSLCDLLNDSNLATAHLAFETLLKIASLSTGDLPPVDNVYFDMIRAPQIKRLLNSESAMNSPIDLAGLLRTDYLAEIANDREKWLQAFASLISKVLGQRWKFFQPCSELLATNRHLARRCLPALIQALLLDTEGPATRQILSTYFEALIDRRSPCAVDVMELVLALRASSPPQDFAGLDNSTSYDLWLSVPYSKLGQIAMEAQEYSAALLCIELSREYSHIESGKQSQEKELLYEVYSHLQEPDGFYSISAFDLPHGLVRRLQHEGRWLEALSWHGAGLEAAPHKQEGVSEIQKILACLAHGDLSHLSMKLFQANPQATGLSEILPSLAWKTQSWDIPVPQDPEMQAQYRIYDALKSTAGSGGNITQEDSLLHLSKEVIALTSIEKSTPAVDKRRLHNILALREVLQWRENVPLCLNDYAAETVRSLHSFE